MDELIDTEMLVEVEPIQAQDVARAEGWRKLMVQGFGKTAPDCIDDILLDMARHYAMHRAEEREACASVADAMNEVDNCHQWPTPYEIAVAIRSRLLAQPTGQE